MSSNSQNSNQGINSNNVPPEFSQQLPDASHTDNQDKPVESNHTQQVQDDHLSDPDQPADTLKQPATTR